MSLEAALYRSGKSIYEIAPSVNLTPGGVWWRLKKQGVPMSNRWRAVNEAFFDSWTKESAYVLGLLATDGTVTSTRNAIAFSSKDRSLVDSVKDLLQSEHKIGRLTINDKTYWRLSVSSKRLMESVIGLGIVPNKSLLLGAIPIPDVCFGPFLAGVIDGDGSVGYTEHRKPRIRIGMGAGTFIEDIRTKLQGVGVSSNLWVDRKGKHPFYHLDFKGANAVALAGFVYSNHGFGLERKRGVAAQFIS